MTLTLDDTKSAQMDDLLEAHAKSLHITYYCRTAGDNTFLGFAFMFLWDMKNLWEDVELLSQVPTHLILRHAGRMETVYKERTEGDNTWTGMLFLFAQDVLAHLNSN